MNRSKDILKELEETAPLLAGISNIHVLTVPAGYFDHLAEKITANTLLQQHQDPFLFKDNSRREVPEGYFDSLSDAILSKIKKTEAETEADDFQRSFPQLHALKNISVFSVPADYFDNLSNEIVEKISDQPVRAKVVSIGTRWWKYAAAAIVAGVIILSSLQLFDGADHNRELTSYALKVAREFKTPGQFEKGIASLSDDEIVSYLEKSGSILDNDMLTEDTDDSGLPSSYDYLLDENTLKNYLNTLDAVGSH